MITMRVYAHAMPGMQAEAAAKFAALVVGTHEVSREYHERTLRPELQQ